MLCIKTHVENKAIKFSSNKKRITYQNDKSRRNAATNRILGKAAKIISSGLSNI